MPERYFDEDKYDGSFPYGGVPLRDLETAEWEALPKHIQESTDALPYFRKTKPPTVQKSAEKHKETVTDG